MVFIPNMSKSKKQAEHSQQAEVEGVADTYDKLGIRPYVVRVSAKKKKGTSVVNFTDICRLLRRQPKHLLTFLSVELGTSGSIDGSNKLVFKGKLLQQKHVERALRRYVRDYVECRACLSPNTVLQKDDAALDFLQCEACHARCLVASIKPVLSQTIAIKNYYMALGSNVRSVDPNVTKKRKRKGQARRWIFLYTLYLYLHCIYCSVVLCFGLESAIPRLV